MGALTLSKVAKAFGKNNVFAFYVRPEADYGVGAEAVDRVVAQLEAHGMVRLGEDRAVPAVAAAGAGLGFGAIAGFSDETVPLAAGDGGAAESGCQSRPVPHSKYKGFEQLGIGVLVQWLQVALFREPSRPFTAPQPL